MEMKAYYNDTFALPLPDGHRFPLTKYRLLRERVLECGMLPYESVCLADAASDEQILRCHDPAYLDRVKSGTLSRKEILRIGFPWSLELVERARRSSGATIGALHAAIHDGVGVNLAGGTHHAGVDFGAGYSVFNDSMIAARELQQAGFAERIAIIDCDVHQGNGTAHIAANDTSVFTFSIHAERNFPFRKVESDLDIGLADDIGDEEYLATLGVALERIWSIFPADAVIYQSGADPYIHDKLGKLALSKEGLAARDRMVLSFFRAEQIPVAVTMGGGYAKQVDDIVDIHLQTVQIAAEFAHN